MYDYESLSVRKIGFFLLKNSLAYEMRVLLARPLVGNGRTGKGLTPLACGLHPDRGTDRVNCG